MHARALHPTLSTLAALRHLRRGHHVTGPNLGQFASRVAGLVGLDVMTDLTSRVVGGVAGVISRVGADDGPAVPDDGPIMTHDKGFMSIVQQAAAAANAPPPQFISRTMSAGMQGDDVREWQGMLGIAQTGVFDSATVAATKAFQAAHGLVVDGIAGPKTISAMFGQNAALPPPEPAIGPSPAPAPAPAPLITPPPTPLATPTKGMPLWKKILLGVAVAGAGFVALENTR